MYGEIYSSMRPPTYDFIIVGAGIVGLSTAYKLNSAFSDANILVLEKEERVAAHQTGKNSGVIHSGIYYKPGSYKAKNCVDGRHQLVNFCEEQEVKIDICGKVIVATKREEEERLDAIYKRGLENNIEGVAKIDRNQLLELEPYVNGVSAIHVPCAGIVDYAGMCEALKRLLEASNGHTHFNSKVVNISQNSTTLHVDTPKKQYKGRFLINCAGLYSDHIAKSADITSPVKIVPFKGEYYELKPEAEYLVNNLIYPLPNPEFPFLDPHWIKRANGTSEIGPNAVPVPTPETYDGFVTDIPSTISKLGDILTGGAKKLFLNPEFLSLITHEFRSSLSKDAMVERVMNFIPKLQSSYFTKKGTSGIRTPVISPEGNFVPDVIEREGHNSFHIVNYNSPGATGAPAFSALVIKKLQNKGILKNSISQKNTLWNFNSIIEQI